MSYILEALKKLEQKRHQEEAPKALTFRGDLAKETKRKRSFWPYVLVALLVINASLLLLWVGPWRTKTIAPQQPVASAPIHQDTPAKAATPSPAAPVDSNATEKTLTPPKSPPVAPAPEKPKEAAVAKPTRPPEPSPSRNEPQSKVRVERKVMPSGKIINAKELPPDVKNTLPEIKMSVHFYDTDPKARFAIINNKTVKEGQAVAQGLKLESITSEGVVLGAQGHRFLLKINESF